MVNKFAHERWRRGTAIQQNKPICLSIYRSTTEILPVVLFNLWLFLQLAVDIGLPTFCMTSGDVPPMLTKYFGTHESIRRSRRRKRQEGRIFVTVCVFLMITVFWKANTWVHRREEEAERKRIRRLITLQPPRNRTRWRGRRRNGGIKNKVSDEPLQARQPASRY